MSEFLVQMGTKRETRIKLTPKIKIIRNVLIHKEFRIFFFNFHLHSFVAEKENCDFTYSIHTSKNISTTFHKVHNYYNYKKLLIKNYHWRL